MYVEIIWSVCRMARQIARNMLAREGEISVTVRNRVPLGMPWFGHGEFCHGGRDPTCKQPYGQKLRFGIRRCRLSCIPRGAKAVLTIEIKSRDMMLEIARRDCSHNDVFGCSLCFCANYWQYIFLDRSQNNKHIYIYISFCA